MFMAMSSHQCENIKYYIQSKPGKHDSVCPFTMSVKYIHICFAYTDISSTCISDVFEVIQRLLSVLSDNTEQCK